MCFHGLYSASNSFTESLEAVANLGLEAIVAMVLRGFVLALP